MHSYNPATFSKMVHRFPYNYPKQVISGKGAYIYDIQNNSYLDFCCSLGPIILGYRNPVVDEAVIKTIRDEGTIFSLSHPKERVLANLLCDLIPCAEIARFMHNGKDVTAAAVRLARHVTDRNLIVSFSYHGATDVFMAATKADKGVPVELKKNITEFDYNDFDRVRDLFDKYEIACVIMEPHTIRKPKKGFLQLIRDLCSKHETILIFDEIVTFPRYPKISAQKTFGVIPDLTCVSKGIANGYPISALVGREEYMKEIKDGGMFSSTTFGGNLIGVSAAIACLTEVVDKDVPEYLNNLGKKFRKGIKNVKVTGSCDSRLFFEFKNDLDRWKLWQECIKEGIFFHVPIFFNFSQSEHDIEKAIAVVNSIDLSKVELVGEIPKEVFKKK